MCWPAVFAYIELDLRSNGICFMFLASIPHATHRLVQSD